MKEETLLKILEWTLSDDTGVSSKAICRYMLGIENTGGWPMWASAPSDASDRGRCIRLLNLMPEWWGRLSEMEVFPDWKEQIPLIRKESNL